MITIAILQFVSAKDNFYYQNNQKIIICPLYSVSRNNSQINYYKNNQGIVLGITDKLILKLKNNKYLDNILAEFNLTLEKTLSNNMYLLKTVNKNSTIDISNRLSEKKYVKYSHPDFIKKRINR